MVGCDEWWESDGCFQAIRQVFADVYRDERFQVINERDWTPVVEFSWFRDRCDGEAFGRCREHAMNEDMKN